MAVTISQYNGTLQHLLQVGCANISAKVQLLNNSATFTASHSALTSVNNSGAYEVDGSGWDSGGEAITLAAAVATTNDAIVDSGNLSITATGGPIGPAYKAVVYDDADGSDKPLWFVDFGGAKTADEGADFNWTVDADGYLKVSIT